MRAAIVSVVSVVLGGGMLFGAACDREPAIVVRFEPADQGKRAETTPVPQDAANPSGRDAASAIAAGGEPRPVPKPSPAEPAAKAAPTPPVGSTAPAVPVGGTPLPPKKAAECAAEADCVVVPDGCCGCANGGKQRAVPRRDEAKLRAAQQASCKDVMCTMMVSTDPTCGKRAACVEGMCAMREARPEELPRRIPKQPAK